MGPILEGVFAVNKPKMVSSAQVLRDLQHHFNPSEIFAPLLAQEQAKINRDNHNQRARRKAEKKAGNIKIGHGGTLDPLATGVLITGIGIGTKSLSNFLLCTKTYEAVILFGTSTDTYDRLGKVLVQAPYEHITKELVEKELDKFRGKFKQLPPLFSALKMDGKPLYEYAREGKELPRSIERRDVEVLELELVEWMEGGTHSHEAPSEEAGPAEINIANKLWSQEGSLPAGRSAEEKKSLEDFETKKRKLSDSQDELVSERPASKRMSTIDTEEATMSGGLAEPISADTAIEETPEQSKPSGPPAARIRMTVTSGFYVRSLAHDLGSAVGSAALLAELERTRQQQYEVGKNCLEYSDLDKGEAVWGPKVKQWLENWEKGVERPDRDKSINQFKGANQGETLSGPKESERKEDNSTERESATDGTATSIA